MNDPSVKKHIGTLKTCLRYSIDRIVNYDHTFGNAGVDAWKQAQKTKADSLAPLKAAEEWLNSLLK